MPLGICRPPKRISQQWFMQNLGGGQTVCILERWKIGNVFLSDIHFAIKQANVAKLEEVVNQGLYRRGYV